LVGMKPCIVLRDVTLKFAIKFAYAG
jgi:hypothetical protein